MVFIISLNIVAIPGLFEFIFCRFMLLPLNKCYLIKRANDWIWTWVQKSKRSELEDEKTEKRFLKENIFKKT